MNCDFYICSSVTECSLCVYHILLNMTQKRNTRSVAHKSISDVNPEDLSEDGKIIVTLLTQQLDMLRSEFKEQMQDKDKVIKNMKIEINTLKVQLLKIEDRMDEDMSGERRNTIVFSGADIPIVAAGENCGDIIRNIAKTTLRIILNPSDIVMTRRLGKKPVDETRIDRRSISVQLARGDLKGDILSACRDIKPNFYVNESLTPVRSTILYVLRKVKKKHPGIVDGCNSIDGRIFAWVKPSDSSSQRNKKVLVNSHLQLTKFCDDILKDPLQSFLDVWPH